MAKEYDVFMAMWQRSSRAFTELMNIFIKLAESGCKVDLKKSKVFKKYVDEKNMKSVLGLCVNANDYENLLKYNKEAKEDFEKLSEEELAEKYNNNNFSFDLIGYKTSQNEARIIFKDKDVDKVKDLFSYMDKIGIKHDVGKIVKDIRNLSSENKAEIEIENKDTFSIISNLLSSYHINYEVVNHQNSDGLIINIDDQDLAANIIDKCGSIDPYEKSEIIRNRIKPINDRSESAENYKKAISFKGNMQQ